MNKSDQHEIISAIQSGSPFSGGLLEKYRYSQIYNFIEKLIALNLVEIRDRKISTTPAGERLAQEFEKNRSAKLDDLPERKIDQIGVYDMYVPRRSVLREIGGSLDT